MESNFIGHKKIVMFQVGGEIDDDSNIIKIRNRFEKHLVNIMKSKGYVPHLDIEPAFSLEYKEDKYSFLLSMYGVFVGKAKAKCYIGISANNLVPDHTTMRDK